jgi:hypothetical protein
MDGIIMINGFKTLLASAVLTIFCSQANAESEISLKNNSDGKVWVKFVLLYPETAACRQSFPSNEEFNLILEPKSSAKAGPFEGDCTILISGSMNNKYYYFCENNFDTTTDVNAELSVNENEAITC